MTYRVWLSKTAEANFITAKEKKYSEEREVTRFQGLEVVVDIISGKSYVSIYNIDPIDPTAQYPSFPKGCVSKVTFVGKYFEGFRKDGIYRYKGAIARLETQLKLHTPHNLEDKRHLEVFQEIQVSAGSVRTLREIYTKVRAGEIQPTKDWSSKASDHSLEELLGLMKLAGAPASGGLKALSGMN